jgi:hypothetical protein
MSRPARTVFLHVGAAKTGTTYLQEVLHDAREPLAAAGVLVPGGYAEAHFEAALDLRGIAFGGHEDPGVRGRWDRLVAESLAWEGRAVVISHELFGGSQEQVVGAVADAFGDAELHVLLTGRDLGRQVPAMWQEQVKNAGALGFDRYVARLVAEPRKGQAARTFWRQQELAEVAERWCARVPPERFHLVTVPPRGSDPTLLWRRFAQVLGVDADSVDARRPSANRSLSYVGAEVLRHLNRALEGRLEWPAYETTVKGWFAEEMLVGLHDGPRASVPVEHRDWFAERHDAMVGRLAQLGVDVVGDLADLAPDFGEPVAAPDADEVLAAATDALAELVTERAGRHWTGARGERGRTLVARARRSPAVRGLPDGVQRWLTRGVNE